MTESPLWKPLRLSLDIERKIDEAFEALIHAPWGRALASWRPAVDVYETAAAYLVEADLPGVPPDQVEIRVEGQRLTIRGARHSMIRAETARSLQIERASGEFSRSLDLEHPVDASRLETWSEHGILRARLPKRGAAAQPADTAGTTAE